jgi:hypothetical protein
MYQVSESGAPAGIGANAFQNEFGFRLPPEDRDIIMSSRIFQLCSFADIAKTYPKSKILFFFFFFLLSEEEEEETEEVRLYEIVYLKWFFYCTTYLALTYSGHSSIPTILCCVVGLERKSSPFALGVTASSRRTYSCSNPVVPAFAHA